MTHPEKDTLDTGGFGSTILSATLLFGFLLANLTLTGLTLVGVYEVATRIPALSFVAAHIAEGSFFVMMPVILLWCWPLGKVADWVDEKLRPLMARKPKT